MRSIIHPNVNRAFAHGMQILQYEGEAEESRNGPVKVLGEPLCTTYTRPMERVLFSKARRANPFFHLFEAMWMLTGSRDGKFLNTYVSDFTKRFAEPGGRLLHGAYGHRWRNHFYNMDDQLMTTEHMLRRDPGTRRAVIAMWDPLEDLDADKRDIPCNTHIYPRLHNQMLDLTICCRSNDAVWGLFGANAVHFSVLQEYLAWRLNVRVGAMHTLSNNFHVYESTQNLWNSAEEDHDLYSRGLVEARPLFEDCSLNGSTERMLEEWIEDPCGQGDKIGVGLFDELLFPMARVHDAYKHGTREEAQALLPTIGYADWRNAAALWLGQRAERRDGTESRA